MLSDVEATDATRAPSRSSLGDEVYEKLLSQLILLEIAPGTRISVDGTARRLGVSQTPVRAALIRLEAQGLVCSAHNLGFSAAPLPTGEQLAQIYEFRLMVEPYLARKAAEQMTRSDDAELAELVDQMEQLRSEDAVIADYGRFAILDGEFHRWIAAKAGNQVAVEALERLHVHMHLFRIRFHSAVTNEALTEHRAIVDAILSRDGIAASAAMSDHIRASRARIEPFLK